MGLCSGFDKESEEAIDIELSESLIFGMLGERLLTHSSGRRVGGDDVASRCTGRHKSDTGLSFEKMLGTLARVFENQQMFMVVASFMSTSSGLLGNETKETN